MRFIDSLGDCSAKIYSGLIYVILAKARFIVWSGWVHARWIPVFTGMTDVVRAADCIQNQDVQEYVGRKVALSRATQHLQDVAVLGDHVIFQAFVIDLGGGHQEHGVGQLF